jgi:glutaredoxin
MKKNTKIFIGLGLVVLGAIGWGAYSLGKESPTIVPKTEIMFFYGRECPHCQDVERFLKENALAEKMEFDAIEVWHNNENAKLLFAKARECGMAEKEVPVPFLYAKGQCFIGTPPVEEFFTDAMEKNK